MPLVKKGVEKLLYKLPGVDGKCQKCYYWPKKCKGLAVCTEKDCQEKIQEILKKKGGKA